MKTDFEALQEQISSFLDSLSRVDVKDVPGIDLYMDQLTTFMDDHLRSNTRDPHSDKILTKTMINNYAKNDLLPPPVRKKYSRDHLLLLVFIYYFKNILSISDIQKLLEPVKQYFQVSDTEAVTLRDIYRQVLELSDAAREPLEEDIRRKMDAAEQAFEALPGEDGDELRLFSFLALLAYDVYLKKMIIEKVLDRIPPEPKANTGKDKKAKDKGAKRKDA